MKILRNKKRFFAGIAAFLLIMLNLFPAVAAASAISPMKPGTPMEPGIPMTPGIPMDPGNPMQPGTPMTPGIPMEPGTPMTPGDSVESGDNGGSDDGNKNGNADGSSGDGANSEGSSEDPSTGESNNTGGGQSDQDNGSAENSGPDGSNEAKNGIRTKNENSPGTNNGKNVENAIDTVKETGIYYSFGTRAAPGGLSWGMGYRIRHDGSKLKINGPRDISGRWQRSFAGKKLNSIGAGRVNKKIGGALDSMYHDERGIKRHATVFNKNTKDLNVQKNIRISSSIKSGLQKNYGKNILKTSNNLKGGGLVGHALTFGGNIVSYGWGKNAAANGGPGYGSTDFAASMITDGAIAGGTTALSSVAATWQHPVPLDQWYQGLEL
ncbi:hypothetical protein GCM10007063_34770 [Lentibacillus kapialis]|uniref:Uncharacterized protein n=1 Tax=Lentibacillus kapialis TaxID=340214 RepID=A0A917Q307_9BACI|nr:hypothetical protein [Lentibacillus kapialis]GGK09351.1 hypothetical protein GCM10007063_34770 [Lentibacillus kapialis]